LNEGAGAGNH